MFKDKSPGLKILWVWTIGTAAVLVTSVVRTRLRDMEKFMSSEEQQQTISVDSIKVDDSPDSEQLFREEKS